MFWRIEGWPPRCPNSAFGPLVIIGLDFFSGAHAPPHIRRHIDLEQLEIDNALYAFQLSTRRSAMLDNVLIPTDGTEISAQAAAFGVQLAKRMGAKVTVVTVTTPADEIMVGEVSIIRHPEDYEQRASESARAILDAVGKLATEAGVAYEELHARSALPWQGIL